MKGLFLVLTLNPEPRMMFLIIRSCELAKELYQNRLKRVNFPSSFPINIIIYFEKLDSVTIIAV